MRILHTSDWHLDHKLHERDRTAEHEAFLDWLLQTLEDQTIDALLITGDIFDVANPRAAAQRQWYGFLARAAARLPGLQIVVIGGNHDSPSRLDAPTEVLRSLRVHVVGGLPRTADRALDLSALVIPLYQADGTIGAWACAVPFLRAADLPRVEGSEDPVVDGVSAIYAEVVAHAASMRQPDQAIVALGHAHLHGAAISELSERRVLVGNQGALPTAIFPDDVAYVALGHLHRAQRVGAESIRYAGSPIPLSVPERHYTHQVLRVDLDGSALAGVEGLPIPRTRDLLRIPDEGAAPLADVLAQIQALPPGDPSTEDASRWPMLQVAVALSSPDPTAPTQVEDALHGRRATLLSYKADSTGSGAALADERAGQDLRQLEVEDVFLRCWSRRFDEPPTPEVLRAFQDLLQRAYDEVSP